MYIVDTLYNLLYTTQENTKANAEAIVDPRVENPSNGLRITTVTTLLDDIDELVKNEKTPLLLDTSEEHFLASFFSYKSVFMVCVSMCLSRIYSYILHTHSI